MNKNIIIYSSTAGGRKKNMLVREMVDKCYSGVFMHLKELQGVRHHRFGFMMYFIKCSDLYIDFNCVIYTFYYI